ncbi:YicC family protein [Paenibacillus sp. CC-CFT747]|nr:YicC family protein [Paenibacillus sp. CC-CFT747]
MIRSMTGFGQASRTTAGFRMHAEVKTVNHRYLEASLRLPPGYSALEESLKREIRERMKRGRVDAVVTISREGSGERSGAAAIDWELAGRYVEAAQTLKERFGLPGEVTAKDLLALPGLFLTESPAEEEHEPVAALVNECLRDALEQAVTMRKREGAFLHKDLSERLSSLRSLHSLLSSLAPLTVEEYRSRLRQRISDLLGEVPVDEQRLANETAFFAERADIQEELTRLESHFGQFAGLLEAEEPAGRKLDFLIQEMNREVNTIGSKGSQAQISAAVVEWKAELEKIREQVQNIE